MRGFFLRYEQEPYAAMVQRGRMRKPDEGCEILRSESVAWGLSLRRSHEEKHADQAQRAATNTARGPHRDHSRARGVGSLPMARGRRERRNARLGCRSN